MARFARSLPKLRLIAQLWRGQRRCSLFQILRNRREEPFIDLLSTVPKALGKRPQEKDEERRKLRKRRHKQRTTEQEQLEEALKGSQREEELRLEELQTRADGASSGLLPTEMDLTSGFDIAMESQTPIILPLSLMCLLRYH